MNVPWLPHSIKTRVTLSALAVFLLSLWLLSSLTSWLLEKDTTQLVANAQTSAASQVAAQIDRELNSRLEALEQSAEMIGNDLMADPVALQKALEQCPLLKTLFTGSVQVVNSSGISIANAPYTAERIGTEYRHQVDAIAAALDDGRASVGSPRIGLVTGQPLVPLAVPIRDDDGLIIGALGGAIDLSLPTFFDDLTAQGYGRTGTYSVVSRSLRTVVTSTDRSRIMLELPQPGVVPVIDRVTAGAQGTDIYTNEHGVTMLATVVNLEITDWFVAVMTPVADAFAPIEQMKRRMTLVSLLVALLAALTIWLVLRRQLMPMLQTVDRLRQLEDSDQQLSPLPLTRRQEIDYLIKAFNHLFTTLKQREEDLKKTNSLMQSFLHIGQKMIVSEDQDNLLQEIVNSATRALGLDTGAVYLLADNNTVQLEATLPELPEDFPAEFCRTLLDDHQCIGNVISSGEYILIADPATANLTAKEREIFKVRGLLSTLFVPIRSQGRSMGVLILSSCHELYDFTDEQITLIQGYADQVAQIVEKNNNYKQIAEHAADLEQEISDRIKAEQTLQQKNEELEQFVYIVSHDLKSPLITINTFLGMLQEDIEGNNTEGITEDFQFIREATAKMERLLNALLQLSRVGRIDSSPQTQPVKKLVDDCLHILAGPLQQRRIEVAVAELPHQWHGDPLHFAQLWQNLIENAVKYMGDQPRPRIEVGTEQRAEGLVFYVRDNGIGLAPEQHQRIFNVFAQLDRNSEGTGLGLALVKKIVTIYQGDVWVESAGEGQGSCFCFTLPAALVSDPSLSG